MTKSNHTPLPWIASKMGSKNIYIMADRPKANAAYVLAAVPLDMNYKHQAETNAALIVHRVNNWDKLVEALELADKVMIAVGSLASYDAHVKNGGFEHNTKSAINLAVQCQSQIEAALALAKEGK